MKFARFLFCLSIALAVAIPAVAQEGYPADAAPGLETGELLRKKQTAIIRPWFCPGMARPFRDSSIPARIPPRSESRRWTARSGPSTWNMT